MKAPRPSRPVKPARPGLTVKVSGANFTPKPVNRPALAAPVAGSNGRQECPPHQETPPVGRAFLPARNSPTALPPRPTIPAVPRITATPEPRPTMPDHPANASNARPTPRHRRRQPWSTHRPGRNGTSPAQAPSSFLAEAIRTSQENLDRPPADRRADGPAPPPVPRRPGPGAPRPSRLAPRSPAEADPRRRSASTSGAFRPRPGRLDPRPITPPAPVTSPPQAPEPVGSSSAAGPSSSPSPRSLRSPAPTRAMRR